jgi:sugar phosphate isomerase/epimerase
MSTNAPPIAVALYSLHTEAQRDFAHVLERVAEMGYLGVELESFHGMAPEELRRRVDELGLKITSAQFDLSGPDMQRALEQQQIIGNTRLVSDFGPEHFASRETLEAAAARYNELAAIAREAGMTVGYHNHWWEFSPSAVGRLPIVELLKHLDPDIFVELDTYYVASAWEQTRGTAPVAALAQIEDRVRLVHVKDGPLTVAGPDRGDRAIDVGGLLMDPSTAVGFGQANIRGMLGAMPNVDWHIVEADFSVERMFDLLSESYRYLTESGLSHGRG